MRRSFPKANGPVGRRTLGPITVAAVLFGLYLLWHSSHVSSAGIWSQLPPGIAPGTPVYAIVEGAAGYPYPYKPKTLHIAARRTVYVKLTDNLGGCGLDTVFPNLGPHGSVVVANVPVGSWRYVKLFAPRVGVYTYHCGSNMYFGTIVAQ